MNKLRISVGTSAFNEQNNIETMLKSIIMQKGLNINLSEIIVTSDGSTDKTLVVVRKIRDKRIKVLDDGKRLGQPSRIGQMLKIFSGDVFVLIDSDMVMKDDTTLEEISAPFIKDKKMALVCGNTLPTPGRTFLEKGINNYIFARADLENEYSFGNTAYGAHAFLAYSKKFARTITISPNIINTDAFSYFTARLKGYKTSYAEKAVAVYRSSDNVRDHVNQSTRHLAGGLQLKSIFGSDLVDKGFYVPKKILFKLMAIQLLRNPGAYIFLKALNLFCMLRSKMQHSTFDVKWASVASTKKSIF